MDYPLQEVAAYTFSALRHVTKLAKELGVENPKPGYGVTKMVEGEEIVIIPRLKNLVDYNLIGMHKPNWKFHETAAVKLTVTSQDNADAASAISFIQTQEMLAALTGRKFGAGSTRILIDNILGKSTHSTGVLVYLPILLPKMKERADSEDMLKTLAPTSKALGGPKEKIEITFYAMSSRYLEQFDSTVYNGHDMNGNLVSFFSRHDYPTHTPLEIQGKVESAGPDAYKFDGISTSLTHVKLRAKK